VLVGCKQKHSGHSSSLLILLLFLLECMKFSASLSVIAGCLGKNSFNARLKKWPIDSSDKSRCSEMLFCLSSGAQRSALFRVSPYTS